LQLAEFITLYMENLIQKADFLKNQYTKVLASLSADAPRKWGKMNVQQMIEHMSEYVRIASGKVTLPSVTPEEHLPRVQAFLESEKPFRENTPNSLMGDDPTPVKHTTIQEAINELQAEIDYFFTVHEQEPGRTTPSPFFGVLDFDHQVQLLHKHSTHHLRQFGMDY
jgi:hypothetical protein